MYWKKFIINRKFEGQIVWKGQKTQSRERADRKSSPIWPSKHVPARNLPIAAHSSQLLQKGAHQTAFVTIYLNMYLENKVIFSWYPKMTKLKTSFQITRLTKGLMIIINSLALFKSSNLLITDVWKTITHMYFTPWLSH